MFSVLFEVRPKAEQWNAYLDNAKRLRPELEKVEGFVDNIRYRSLTRDGWILSLSNWKEQRLDETEAAAGTAVTLIDAARARAVGPNFSAEDLARSLGLDAGASGLHSWDVFDAVLSPGTPIVLMSWRDASAAEVFEKRAALPAERRLRRIRIIRDYGMDDRREAPQYYPEVSTHRSNV
jgi:heme-degrading monooxygenase HmoA